MEFLKFYPSIFLNKWIAFYQILIITNFAFQLK